MNEEERLYIEGLVEDWGNAVGLSEAISELACALVKVSNAFEKLNMRLEVDISLIEIQKPYCPMEQ